MTKKHFIAAAEIVLRRRPSDAIQIASAFIELFEQFNVRFDRARFMTACGLAEKEEPQ